MSLRWSLLPLLLTLACAPLDYFSDAGTPQDPPDAADPCNPGPVNISRDTAADLILGENRHGTFCRGHRYWWRAPGTYANGARVRLVVEFDRGKDADDVDFAAGLPNGDGSYVVGRVWAGSCTNPAGQGEQCIVEITAPEGATAIYVVASAPQETKHEGFTLRLEGL
ncbi:MAG: hypothetical protein AB2A00_30885 [Myxococcota bacterium]